MTGAEAREGARGIDWPGLVLLGAAVSLITVPLVLGQEKDWPLWSWVSLASGGTALVLFGVTRSGSPGAAASR